MEKVIVRTELRTIRTYPEPDPEDLPIWAENRVHQRSTGRPYPNKIVLNVCRDRTVDKEYTVVHMENEYLAIDILPEIGGRVFAAMDKRTGYDFFYHQHVIKPALIGVLGSWISGGIEFNWPFHHRASGFMPCDFKTEVLPDGTAVCMLSEHDSIDRMKGMVSIVLQPGKAYFETRMRLYNRTELPKSFLWWENAAVPVNENYRIFFPKDVTYVNFHYLKSRASYPVADAVTYNGIEIRKPTDISWHKNTRDATSYFSSASKYDFFGGYDYGKQCGVVHIGDHHVSPGKKMFTWGYNQLSRSWENALTDTDGAYAELMAGSYSDNQPNFSWLKPYETKEFSQYWYPISQIGAPDYADLNGAIVIDRENGQVKVQMTANHERLHLQILCGETLLAETACAAAAGEVIVVSAPLTEVYITVRVSEDGKTLMRYTEEKPDTFRTPDPIEDTPSAEKLNTVQELYLAGVHVDQYRDPAVYPDAYWNKALRMQKDHIPTLLAMAKFRYRYCRFEEALELIERAHKAQSMLNERPESGEVLYVKGLILEALGRDNEAYDAYRAAAWDGDTVDRAMTRAAMLDLKRGDAEHALACSTAALKHNTENALALSAKLFALRSLGKSIEGVGTEDPFAYTVRLARGESAEQVIGDMLSPSQTVLDIVWELVAMGRLAECETLLTELIRLRSDEATAMVCYTLAYIKGLCGETAETLWKEADAAPIGRTFPNRREELHVLRSASSDNAAYLLGCIAYAKMNFDEARSAWVRVAESGEGYAAESCRCLALLEFNHGDRAKALPLMQKAMELRPDSTQLLYETVILLNKSNAPASDKLSLLKAKEKLITRDDLFTELAKAYNQNSEPEKALKVLAGHDFIPCEGGEHAIAEQYMFAHYLLGLRQMQAGKTEEALEEFRSAQVLPQHLGAGIWNRCRLIPQRYCEALCLDRLGETDAAEAIYEDITSIRIDYFSNMHLKELPCYQALSHIRLGRRGEAVKLLTTFRRSWGEAIRAEDSGYFATTPFFLPFTEKAEDLRTAQFSFLLGCNDFCRDEKAEAAALFEKAYALNHELLFAGCFAGKIR